MKTHAVLIVFKIAWLLTNACYGGWTGIRAYMGNPQQAWMGTSSCPPCNLWCDHLDTHVLGSAWRYGFGYTRADGSPNHIVILRALPDEAVPYFEFVQDGKVVGRMNGYSGEAGEMQAILRQYPGPMIQRQGFSQRPVTFQNQIQFQQQLQSPVFYGFQNDPRQTIVQSYDAAPQFKTYQYYRGICVNGNCQ